MINPSYIRSSAVDVWGPVRFPDEPDKLLLYEYVRGSHAYGLAVESSDQDRGGVYIQRNSALLGMTSGTGMRGYKSSIHSSRHDETWFELSRYAELLSGSNPNILESLFIDDDLILYEHPIITSLKKQASEFVTKQSFPKFGGYAKSQIEKARGLNKKIAKPVNKRKSPLDFVYTFSGQGSVKVTEWLEKHGLYAEYFGLVSVPNMHNVYGAYYDWSSHAERVGLRESADSDDVEKFMNTYRFIEIYRDITGQSPDIPKIIATPAAGYHGITAETSQELKLSSVPDPLAVPVTYFVYNSEGYSQHARDYTSYKKWEEERNQTRYSLNEGYLFDSKNMMHSFRLLTMAVEIAEGRGVILKRTEDREFLLGIRNHKYTYDDLMARLTDLENRRLSAQNASVIPESVNVEKFNEWIKTVRNTFGNF